MKMKIIKETTLLGKVVKVGAIVEVSLPDYHTLRSQGQAVEYKEEPKSEPVIEELTRESIVKAVEEGKTAALKMEDLKKFAEVNKIDLKDAKKKDDIIEAIIASKSS